MKFESGYPVAKTLVQLHQYDTRIKAQRKFDRLNEMKKTQEDLKQASKYINEYFKELLR